MPSLQAWKEHVLPLLRAHLAGGGVDAISSYLLLYHEAAVANLLEVTLYHAHAAEAVPEEHLLELADWCYRKLLWLASGAADAFINKKGEWASEGGGKGYNSITWMPF